MISKISYNGNLYVVGEPITLNDTVEGNIFVPIDDVEAWKSLNQDKNIVGYNFNVKRVTQEEFLPKVINGESTVNDVINLFDGQIVDEITIEKKSHQGHNGNFYSFPFDIQIRELTDQIKALGGSVDGIYYASGCESHVVFNEDHTISKNTFYLINDESITEDTIIKAGKPFGILINETSSIGVFMEEMKFYNKKIKLYNKVSNPCKTDGWYLVSSGVKQHPITGLSTSPQFLAVGSNGSFSKGNIQTANIGAFSAWLEYRGNF